MLTASTRTWVNVSQHYLRAEFLPATTYEYAPCAARHGIFANSGTEGGSVVPQDASYQAVGRELGIPSSGHLVQMRINRIGTNPYPVVLSLVYRCPAGF